VRLKYEKLEKEFLANRKKTNEELNRYMEREVGTVLSQLSNNRMKIEAQLRQNHQVCSLPAKILSLFFVYAHILVYYKVHSKLQTLIICIS